MTWVLIGIVVSLAAAICVLMVATGRFNSGEDMGNCDLRMTPFTHWEQFDDSTLLTKLHVCTLVMTTLRMSDDTRAPDRLIEWENDRVGMLHELRRRGLLPDVVVGLKAASLTARGQT